MSGDKKRRPVASAASVIAANFSCDVDNKETSGNVETTTRKRTSKNTKIGLIIAGIGSGILTTLYSLFYVDVFLRVYKLPLETFATGNFIYSFINTANDLIGAWIIDNYVSRHYKNGQLDVVGLSGFLFVLCFLISFFPQSVWNIFSRTNDTSSSSLLHFVLSMSLYDTMYSFVSILLGSVITDDHTMTDKERIRFMAMGKIINMICTFIAAKVGLSMFNASNDNKNNIDTMSEFRVFLIVVGFLVCLVFLIAQVMVKNRFNRTITKTFESKEKAAVAKTKPSLRFKQVVKDFYYHKNFRAWVGMEMLLECQSNFINSFLKTFIDRLIFDVGFLSRNDCDLILSSIRPLKQITSIILYVPIRRYGYHKVYMAVFTCNLSLSLLCLIIYECSSSVTSKSTNTTVSIMILVFLMVYSILVGSVLGCGFHLAMSDMVLEMKVKHIQQKRYNEPSLAGLFMGANALLCKPMDSFLPIISSYFLNKFTKFSSSYSSSYSSSSFMEAKNENDDEQNIRKVLFYLLIIPPIMFSCLQIISWKQYNLHSERTKKMRDELARLTDNSDGCDSSNSNTEKI